MALRPPSSPGNARPPAINLPPVTLGLLIAMVVVHLVRLVAPPEVDRLLFVHLAFIPAAYLADGWPFWSLLVAPFSYAFLHGGIGHLALNGVMLTVMGQVLERRLGWPRFLLPFAAGTAGGAMVHVLIGGAPQAPLIGASAGVGGLFGAGLILHRRGLGLGPNGQLLVALAGLFIIINLIGVVLPIQSRIAHAAHLGGFVAGALVAGRLSVLGRP